MWPGQVKCHCEAADKYETTYEPELRNTFVMLYDELSTYFFLFSLNNYVYRTRQDRRGLPYQVVENLKHHQGVG